VVAVFTLLREYRRAWLARDVVAGVTVAAIAIPQSLGYASVAGLPVQTGLYCAILPPILFALVASSRQLVVGADSATAALVAAGVAAVAVAGSPEYTAAVGVLGLVTAAFLALLAVARLGFLANLISRPVLTGFLSGVGLQLVLTKLPGVLGVEAHGTTVEKVVDTVQNLGEVNRTSALLGFGVVAVMVGAIRLPPAVPAALFALVAFSVLGAVLDAPSKGVQMIGALPPGLPQLAMPEIHPGDVARLSATAASIAVVILAQSAAVSRGFAAKNGYQVDTNADLYALGAANAGSAITGGFAINGSPPRTAAGDDAGSRSQLVNVVMGVVVALVLVLGSGLFEYVPSPVLDGIVLGVGIGLIKVGELRRIHQLRRGESWTALLCLVVVALVGVEQGILLAVVVSLVNRFRAEYHPYDEVLLADGAVSPRLQGRLRTLPDDRLDGIVVYRFGSSLFFANALRFEERVRQVIAECARPVKVFVIYANAITNIDVTGAETLRALALELQRRGIRLVLTDLSDPALGIVQASGLESVLTVYGRLRQAVIEEAGRLAASDDLTRGGDTA
jgi:high affinity sulfate transporter 1